MRAFVAWAGDRPLAELSASELEFDFLGPWSQGVEKPTLRNRIAALRSLYDFAERSIGAVASSSSRTSWSLRNQPPIRSSRGGGSIRRITFRSTRSKRVIVYLLRYTGLRVSEACALRWEDVDLEAHRLTVRASKTPSGRPT